MNLMSSVVLVGDIENVARKTVNDKHVAEFYLAGCGLRISAWEKRAEDVPESGVVAVTGYISTRTYQYEGKDRTSTDIRALTVQAVSVGLDSDELF